MGIRQGVRAWVQGLHFFLFVIGLPVWLIASITIGSPFYLPTLFNRGAVCFFDPFFYIQSIFAHAFDPGYWVQDPYTIGFLVLSLGTFLVITAVLGRVFCSWICPFGTLIDLTGWVSNFFGVKRKPLPEVLDDRMIKYGLLAGFLLSSMILAREVFCDLCPAGALFRIVGPFYLGFTWQILIPLTVFLFVMILAFKFDTRAWCKYFCPLGAFISIGSKLTPLGRVELPAHACVECGKCERECPMDIPIVSETKYQLVNSKAVKKVLEAEGDPEMLRLPKKFDKLPEPVQEVLNREKGKYKVPAGECIRCFKCVDACPVQAQIIKKAKEEKEAAKAGPDNKGVAS